MKPLPRFLLHMLGPPPICAVLFFATHFLATGEDGHPLVLASLIGYAYLFAGIPSIVHAAIMELCYRRVAAGTRSRIPLVVAAANGSATGTFVALITGWRIEEGVVSTGALLVGCGTLTGMVVGLLVFTRSRA